MVQTSEGALGTGASRWGRKQAGGPSMGAEAGKISSKRLKRAGERVGNSAQLRGAVWDACEPVGPRTGGGASGGRRGGCMGAP
jgi:hypothetical protein